MYNFKSLLKYVLQKISISDFFYTSKIIINSVCYLLILCNYLFLAISEWFFFSACTDLHFKNPHCEKKQMSPLRSLWYINWFLLDSTEIKSCSSDVSLENKTSEISHKSPLKFQKRFQQSLKQRSHLPRCLFAIKRQWSQYEHKHFSSNPDDLSCPFIFIPLYCMWTIWVYFKFSLGILRDTFETWLILEWNMEWLEL